MWSSTIPSWWRKEAPTARLLTGENDRGEEKERFNCKPNKNNYDRRRKKKILTRPRLCENMPRFDTAFSKGATCAAKSGQAGPPWAKLKWTRRRREKHTNATTHAGSLSTPEVKIVSAHRDKNKTQRKRKARREQRWRERKGEQRREGGREGGGRRGEAAGVWAGLSG